MQLSEHKIQCKEPKRKFRIFNIFSCFCRQNNISDTDDDMIKPLPSSFQAKSSKFIGLHNLGNTCFMNSALQCLIHTTILTSFFTSGAYKNKLNKTNPLGTKGRLADAYAEMLTTMQGTTEKTLAPWKIKKTISQFAPQFLGHSQHDSHELLLFLISGLHEDLNQVHKKPSYENDVKEGSDRDMAEESWNRHVSHNQSIVVELMHGQYKSTLHCPNCKKFSYAFDPFSCLSLPIPQNTQKKIQTVFIPFNASTEIITNFTFITDSQTKIKDLISKCLEYLKKERGEVFVMNNQSGCPYQIQGETLVEEIRSISILMFEHPIGCMKFVLLNVYKENSYSLECYSRLVCLDLDETYESLHNKVFDFFKGFFPKLSAEDNAVTLIAQGSYKLAYDPNRLNPCFFCKEKRCKGCDIPMIGRLVKCFYINEPFFIINAIFLKSSKKTIEFTNLKKMTQAKLPQETPLKKNPTIYDCLSTFSLPETLHKNNLWYCPTCKTHVQASKKLELYKVPPILVMHLKRFKCYGTLREKLTIPVEFPIKDLDLSVHVINEEKPPLYDLYAVSNHFGALAGGHYTATVFDENSEKWYNCNDSEIMETRDLSEVASYVLFYKSRNLPNLILKYS